MAEYGSTEKVRRLAVQRYIEPARREGKRQVTIHSGELARLSVKRKILAPNRLPIVCNALRARRFAIENHLTLEEASSPAASGQSSTVTFVFRLEPTGEESGSREPAVGNAFQALRGILRKTYSHLGGAESFHTAEHEDWDR